MIIAAQLPLDNESNLATGPDARRDRSPTILAPMEVISALFAKVN